MMKKLMNFALAAVVATSLWAGSVRAEETDGPTGSSTTALSLSAANNYENLEGVVAEAKENLSDVDDKTKQDLVDRAADALKDGRITAHVNDASFDLEQAEAAREVSGTQTLLTVPIRGPGLVEPSNLTVAFDEDRAVETTIEVQYRGDSTADQGRVTTWTDGEVTLDRMADSAGNSWAPGTAAPASSSAEQITMAWSFNKFIDCLNAQGVSGWVVTAVSLGCAAACAVTAGGGCLPCIAAAGAITSGVVGACVEVAGRS